MEDFKHIIELESILDKHKELINELQKAMDNFENHQGDFQQLIDYYTSENYMLDIDKSNNGEIPSSIKQGILSEDAIYDLFTENHAMAIRFLELGTQIIKDN